MSADEGARYPFRQSSEVTATDGGPLPPHKIGSHDYTENGNHRFAKMTEASEGFRFQDAQSGAPLRKTDTISSISLTPEQFERMYLGPFNEVKGDLRKTLGNPTPIGLGGFLLAFTPLTVEFMHWRAASLDGQATIGSLYFLGGLLALMASVGEFILGNSFPSTFFAVYGGFFVTYGATLTPWFHAYSLYPLGEKDPGFLSSIAFLSAFTGAFTFILLIASIRTNLMFFGAFLMLFLAFMFFTASRFYGAQGNVELLDRYEFVAGATGFASACFGWYLLTAEILTTVDFPINLPLFDLSRYVPSGSSIAKKKRKSKAENDLEHETNGN